MTEPTKERNCKTCRWFNPSYCTCYHSFDMLPRIVLHVCKEWQLKLNTNIPDIRNKGITECTTKCYECSDIDCPSHPIHNED